MVNEGQGGWNEAQNPFCRSYNYNYYYITLDIVAFGILKCRPFNYKVITKRKSEWNVMLKSEPVVSSVKMCF